MVQYKVSVIIPVYKVEQYLERCIESVISQTLKNIEIILVDDGSPDNCPKICDDYKEKHDNIRVIHKDNGGLASARNAGMRASQGEYIFFIDSDDFIDSETLYELVNVAEQYKVDFVRYRPMYFGWANHADGEMVDFGTETMLHEGLYDRDKIKSEVFPYLIATADLSLGAIVAAWRSLYRNSFLLGNHIFFDDGVRYNEDSLFSANVVYRAQSFYYLDGGRYYHYFCNPSSITKSYRSDRWDVYKKLMKAMRDNFGNVQDYDFTNQIAYHGLYCIFSALNDRKYINDFKKRNALCDKIVNDEQTINVLKMIKKLDLTIKEQVLVLLIKYRFSFLLAI